jgi:hypothetical protein
VEVLAHVVGEERAAARDGREIAPGEAIKIGPYELKITES